MRNQWDLLEHRMLQQITADQPRISRRLAQIQDIVSSNRRSVCGIADHWFELFLWPKLICGDLHGHRLKHVARRVWWLRWN